MSQDTKLTSETITTLTEDELIRTAMSLIGKRRSEAKTAAVRANGKLGGKPKGTPTSEETKAKIAAATRAAWAKRKAEQQENQ